MGEGEGKDGVRVEKATVSRTERRLFEGNVLFSLQKVITVLRRRFWDVLYRATRVVLGAA